ncbi:hypothetical protein KC909_06055 [Candidatus Dojkabacteria bacterium]|uniref:Uncharacterized protein n=1 Tax=Candidatus Dojkabacteria bacterium TaxID=2099670 RepID=A0A955RJY2_9BACT|nr:hypothetical protein [Candidatus Dojkabacteria bacterium]
MDNPTNSSSEETKSNQAVESNIVKYIVIAGILFIAMLLSIFSFVFLNKGDESHDSQGTLELTDDQSNSNTQASTINSSDVQATIKFIDIPNELSFSTTEKVSVVDTTDTMKTIYGDVETEIAFVQVISKEDLNTNDFGEDLSDREKALIYFSANQCGVIDTFINEEINGTTVTYGSTEVPEYVETGGVCGDVLQGMAVELNDETFIVVIETYPDSGLIQQILDTFVIN